MKVVDEYVNCEIAYILKLKAIVQMDASILLDNDWSTDLQRQHELDS
jgi:hypothetical protein